MIKEHLPALKAAAETYIKEWAVLQKQWDSIESSQQIEKLEKEEEEAANKLRIAFYNATSDINQPDSCISVDAHFILKFTRHNTDFRPE